MADELYDRIGIGYAGYRRPDPRIAAAIERALGSASSVLNVGAGTGSYEPRDREVVAVEPSIAMIRQRPSTAAPVLRASAERLPLADDSRDAVLTILSLHHWPDWRRGLREMRRVARDRVVVLTCDPRHPGFWLLRDYFPEILEVDRRIMPTLPEIERELGPLTVTTLPIPHDCSDGFLGAYWRRPELYLDDGARLAISSFAKISSVEAGLGVLRRDLDSGAWARQNGDLLGLEELDIGYRLLVAGQEVAEPRGD